MKKFTEDLFTIFLIMFIGLGIVTVLLQTIGLITLNGDLMIFAAKKIMPFAVLGSTIAGAISFIYPYVKAGL